jgi:hypothetical protein
MTPRIEGDVHHFAEQALFNGLFLMRDEESGTFWDHMTGEAVYGPLVGDTLQVAPLLQTTVERALDMAPDASVALSDQAIRTDDEMKVGGLLAGIRGRLNEMFSSTVEREDTRRPTMDLGIGLWTDQEARYYPMEELRARDRAVLDTFAGRRVLIYVDPQNFTPSAILVDGDDPQWSDDVLRLSDGSYVQEGLLYGSDGERLQADRPLQVFTRWYGFSLTFPQTEIYPGG